MHSLHIGDRFVTHQFITCFFHLLYNTMIFPDHEILLMGAYYSIFGTWQDVHPPAGGHLGFDYYKQCQIVLYTMCVYF